MCLKILQVSATEEMGKSSNLTSSSVQNLFQIRACVISPRKERQDILMSQPMFTYSHKNTTLGQSEGAYYLSYIIYK